MSSLHRVLPALAALGLLAFASCSAPRQTPKERYEAAKTAFEQAVKDFHNPSADATGTERLRLQNEAALRYQQLLDRYPEHTNWCAQALRGQAGLRAAQTNLDEAVRLYAQVEQRYPQLDWEVLMALKSAGDLLWDANRRDPARLFYQKLVTRFDKPDAPAIIQTAVRGSKARLAQPAPPVSR